jgi:DNA-directed RNA polymerase subunit M/transcription elongation factor TFIIS
MVVEGGINMSGGIDWMWKFKGCPRCHGDVFVDEDIDKTYVKCLQCGYEREMNKTVARDYSRRKEKAGSR